MRAQLLDGCAGDVLLTRYGSCLALCFALWVVRRHRSVDFLSINITFAERHHPVSPFGWFTRSEPFVSLSFITHCRWDRFFATVHEFHYVPRSSRCTGLRHDW